MTSTSYLTEEAAAAKLAEYLEELERAEAEGAARFRAAFESSPAGIGVHELDAKGVIMRVNGEELKLLGYRADEMVGRPAWDFAVMQGVSQRAVEKKLSGEKELKAFVRTFHRKDGSGVALLLLDRLVRDASGKAIGIRTAVMPAPRTT